MASLHLQALGRLEDAAVPLRAAVELGEKQGETPETLATGARNLCSLLISIGWLGGEDGAIPAGKKAVSFAVRSAGAIDRMSTHAPSPMRYSNRAHSARPKPYSARPKTCRTKPSPACFASLPGRRTNTAPCCSPAATWMRQMTYPPDVVPVRSRPRYAPADIGSELVAQAHAALAAVPPRARAPEECAVRSGTALAALRQANQEACIVPGLLAHAEALWRCGNPSAAGEPLREAETIARRTPMPLFLADANLLAASIQLSEGRIARARTCLDNAAALIGKHGYGRGALHLAVLNAEIANAGKAADREGMIAAAIKASGATLLRRAHPRQHRWRLVGPASTSGSAASRR